MPARKDPNARQIKVGSTILERFGRQTNGVSLDPAREIQQAAPNFGRPIVPHGITFSSYYSNLAHVYKNPDEAYRNSPLNARIMRNDCYIMEPLEARQRGTALLNWHLETENPKDPREKLAVEVLTDIITRIRDFTEYRRVLMEACWYGRYACQNLFDAEIIRGQRCWIIRDWLPLNGDKLVFRFDDGTGKFKPGQVGIKVNYARGQKDVLAGNRVLDVTDQGMAYFLEEWERERLTIHRHIVEDGDYDDVFSAGSIFGVGIRSRIYWNWFQRQACMAQLMEVVERTGQGFYIYFYPDGDALAQAATEKVAQNQAHTNYVLIPRREGDSGADSVYGVDMIPPNTAGLDALKQIAHDLMGLNIKRYIVGQELSSEAKSTGLGSSVGDFQQETYAQIIKYDANKLEETMTRGPVAFLKKLNFPHLSNCRIQFKIDTKEDEPDKKLQAYESAYNMGLRIKASEVADVIGASMPTGDDEVLVKSEPQVVPPMGGFGGDDKPGMPGDEEDADAYNFEDEDEGDNPFDGDGPGDDPDGPRPQLPQRYARDAQGHEHAPAGSPEGGQFVPKRDSDHAAALQSLRLGDKHPADTAIGKSKLNVRGLEWRDLDEHSASVNSLLYRLRAVGRGSLPASKTDIEEELKPIVDSLPEGLPKQNWMDIGNWSTKEDRKGNAVSVASYYRDLQSADSFLKKSFGRIGALNDALAEAVHLIKYGDFEDAIKELNTAARSHKAIFGESHNGIESALNHSRTRMREQDALQRAQEEEIDSAAETISDRFDDRESSIREQGDDESDEDYASFEKRHEEENKRKAIEELLEWAKDDPWKRSQLDEVIYRSRLWNIIDKGSVNSDSGEQR